MQQIKIGNTTHEAVSRRELNRHACSYRVIARELQARTNTVHRSAYSEYPLVIRHVRV